MKKRKPQAKAKPAPRSSGNRTTSGLTDRQQRFVNSYLTDPNATKAALAAGYSTATADQQGSRLLKNVKVQQVLNSARHGAEEQALVDAGWVLGRLKENVERSMQASPVLDRDGKLTGQYAYQGAVANKALELLGKHLNLFAEKHEHRHTGTGAGGELEHVVIYIPDNGRDPIPGGSAADVP